MIRHVFIEGAFEGSPRTVEVHAPFDGRVVATVHQATRGQVERALAVAHAGRGRLAALSAGQRRDVLDGVVAGLEARAKDFVDVLVAEAGKPVTAAKAEVQRATETFRLAADELSRFGGAVVPVDLLAAARGAQATVRRFPAGVVVGIVPFNFPLNLGAHKVAPALAVGAPIVVKPPPQAPSAMLLLAELAKAAGADPAALQVLPCSVAEAEALATDPRVRVTSFTGSAKVGWHLKAKVAGKAVLELGGSAAAVVARDADLPLAAKRLAAGGFAYAGQVCIKTQRVLVEGPAWEPFLAAFVKEVDALGVGDPARAETVIGPVIDAAAADRIEAWVDEAIRLGALVHRRGARLGNVLGPTVLSRVPRTAKCWAEEIFGPVVVLEEVNDLAQALEALNDSRYGLQAAVFSHDLRTVRRVYEGAEVGGVIVNDSTSFRSDAMPYGGVKDSGLSREGVRSTMEDFTEERVLVDRTPV